MARFHLRHLNRRVALALALAAVGCVNSSSYALQHFWDIKEVYSNHDGSVQFIEFFTTFDSQQFLNAHTITATSIVGGSPTVKTFTFPSNLSVSPPNPSSTLNRHMLIATPGFGGLAGGVTADFPLNFLPAGGTFFNPNADSITINFGPNFDIVTFAGSALPKDGVNSLTDQSPAGAQNLVAGLNSPTNFPEAMGSVNQPPPAAADFTENGVVNGFDLAVWRTNFGTTGTATHLQGDSDNDDDVDGVDFLTWQEQTTNTGSALAAGRAVPEPATGALVAIGALWAMRSMRRARRVESRLFST